MIGDKNLADTIGARWSTLPEGFTFLGEGSTRVVFLGPDGVVYKVMNEWYDDENRAEWDTYNIYGESLSKNSEGRVRLAPCTLYGNVLAMEYVPMAAPAMFYADDSAIFPDWVAEAAALTMYFDEWYFDAHAFNLWFDEAGVLTLIDYAP